MKASNTDLIILAAAKAKPGKEADLERALRDVAGPTRKQPGCIQFTLLRAAGDKSMLLGIERWGSQEAHEKHLQGDHVKQLMARMAEILAAPPSIVAYEAIDE